jgi:hypothetical protein
MAGRAKHAPVKSATKLNSCRVKSGSVRAMSVTRVEITDEWINMRRAILQRERYPVRAGPDRTIEVRVSDRGWGALSLRDGERCFATEADRDAVLERLRSE